ncbi:MAG: hypothetical protein VX899_21900 [Myxococcota bacterium]|nr:hypothetical protein [Myxococcota bacterium]
MKKLLAPFAVALVAGALVATPAAFADEDEAESCLRTKIWDGYNDGWAVRTATSASLKQGEHRIYMVTLYEGNEYKISACADAHAKNVDVLLYDSDGNVLAQDDSQDRQPSVSHKPTTTATYYVAVHATELADTTAAAGVGMAVTYR